jgi:hypothetical protein
VADLLGGLTSSGWLFLFAWVLPSSIFVSGVATLVLPAARDAIAPEAAMLASFAFVEQSLVLAFLALALGLVMGAASTPLYRLLEGYSWPRRLRNWGMDRQRSRKELIAKSVEELEDGPEKALRYEELQRFPGDPDVAPSRLGNALRALVHLGRKELAAGLGLRLQRELEQEREMWHLLAAFVFYPYDPKWADRLDEYRTATAADAGDAGDVEPA